MGLAGVLGWRASPKTYRVQTKLLAQRNQVIANLSNPRRAIPDSADSPTKAASETVLRRDNLISVIHQTSLMKAWRESRPPLLRLKDSLMDGIRGPTSEEDRIDALVAMLEKRLTVQVGDGNVIIAVEWPDPQSAYRIVETAEQNFLEARHVAEVSSIAEAISILEGHAANVREEILGALEQEQKKARPAVASDAPEPKPAPLKDNQELTQLKVMLVAKRRAIKDLDEFRLRRLGEMQARLAELKATYADTHPLVIDAKQAIAQLQEPSPQITALKAQEAELLRGFLRRGGKMSDLDRPDAPVSLPQETTQRARVLHAEPSQDAVGEYSRSQLKFAIENYQSLLERIDGARIELDTARAAFKYRYTVVTPAQMPKKPVKPNPVAIIAGSAIAGLFLAIFAAAVADVRSGLLLERWQVERALGLPVIGELKR
jgi:uncharacterized protein involved in exopolysaccharide biosynthesis